MAEQGLTIREANELYWRTPREHRTQLLESLLENDAQVRHFVATFALDLPHAEAYRLLELLAEDSDESVRVQAARGLGRVGDQRGVRPLLRILRAGDDSRDSAVDALGILGNSVAVPDLVALVDESASVGAIAALGKIGDERALPCLLRSLSSRQKPVRIAAAKAIAAIDHPDAYDPLLRLIHHGSRSARVAASAALELMEKNRHEGHGRN